MLILHYTTFLVFKFWQGYGLSIHSSGMRFSIVGYLVPGISRQHSGLTCKGKNIQRCSTISQKNRFLMNITYLETHIQSTYSWYKNHS